jgi:hypothetical protein
VARIDPVDRPARTLRRAAVAVAVLGAALLAFALLTHEPPELTGASLSRSVQREVGAGPVGSRAACTRKGDGRWLCDVADGTGSGGVTYAVTVRDGACWDARLVAGLAGSGMPRAASGCLT